MDIDRVKVGRQVKLTVVPTSGAILLMPLRQGASKKEITEAKRKLRKITGKTLRKLSERDTG